MDPLISEAKKEIATAAGEAAKVIAQAAAEATKVIASAAAESVKVANVQNSSDHDLLIELKTRMVGLKESVDSIQNGTSTQIADHETRINSLETAKTKQNTLMGIGIGILTLLVSLMTYHMIK
jgi:hypothetical protein